MVAVSWTSLLGPIIIALIASWLPGLSAGCGGEAGGPLRQADSRWRKGAVNFVAGYAVRELSKIV